MSLDIIELTRARESRAAIEKLYIEMRHIFNSGSYSPSTISGRVLLEALHTLRPEIYGSIDDMEKVELNGLVYVMERLPKGIEQCRFLRLISDEGYSHSGFEVIIPAKRRRNCYKVDNDLMLVEVTRGRSEIYDILTHLTFMYNEAEKIKSHAFDKNGNKTKEWEQLEKIVEGNVKLTEHNRDLAFSHLSTLLGRTFEQTKQAFFRFEDTAPQNSGLFRIVYWLGKVAHAAEFENQPIQITFTPTLRDRIGHHIHGEQWATNIKKHLIEHKLLDRPIHIISANMHSVMNSLCALSALKEDFPDHKRAEDLAQELSKPNNQSLNNRVRQYAEQCGMLYLNDNSGTNISVQVFDTTLLDLSNLPVELKVNKEHIKKEKPVIIVMDYAFGEQAYETMDELLKPYKNANLLVKSISVMGKAGILHGGKGDLMIPSAHVFEGTADNYPLKNEFTKDDFKGSGLNVYEGAMISVLGTSLQNRDVLAYFRNSSWRAVGLEMEGAHYQKAIQAGSMIRNNVSSDITLRYAYYASDNPLLTGGTLSSGSLGTVGVKPTYLITTKILNKILNPK
ncbi:DUF6909 family protein [Microscilla marina]|uniref:Uncharacterized protein n=1 Tax=Microscilla marina ATCC 23134 TaxID=313606 RepID=A1ZJE2_MICM2|nr:hypothetical protein [Microscilla marina]EAY29678.1 conserved hypothetical protein [Microscilla marina ATCC 23134]